MSSRSLFAACIRNVVAPATKLSTMVRSPLTLFSRSMSFNTQSRVSTLGNGSRNHPVGCQKRCCSTLSSAHMMPSGLPLVEELFGRSELDTYNAGTEIHHFTPTKYIEFNCNVCNETVAKTFSKHSYEKGVVIVRCGGCKNLHLIADHLGFTGYSERNVEEIAAGRGETITTKWEGEQNPK